MAKRWSKKEEDFLKKHYRTMGREKLAKRFSVSPDAVRLKGKSLGLVRKEARPKKVRKEKKKVVSAVSKRWTLKEEHYLKKHYVTKTNVELAERLKTTSKSVEKKLWRMGLKRKKKVSKVSVEDRNRRIREFLKEARPAEVEKKTDEHRSRAVAQFDAAINLYYAKKYKQAESAFGKVVKDFTDVYDIVYKAEQYIGFCLDKK